MGTISARFGYMADVLAREEGAPEKWCFALCCAAVLVNGGSRRERTKRVCHTPKVGRIKRERER